MDGIKKLLSALVVLAAGIFWATHAHAAAPTAVQGHREVPGYDRMNPDDFGAATGSQAAGAEPGNSCARRTTECARRATMLLPAPGIGHRRGDSGEYLSFSPSDSSPR